MSKRGEKKTDSQTDKTQLRRFDDVQHEAGSPAFGQASGDANYAKGSFIKNKYALILMDSR